LSSCNHCYILNLYDEYSDLTVPWSPFIAKVEHVSKQALKRKLNNNEDQVI